MSAEEVDGHLVIDLLAACGVDFTNAFDMTMVMRLGVDGVILIHQYQLDEHGAKYLVESEDGTVIATELVKRKIRWPR